MISISLSESFTCSSFLNFTCFLRCWFLLLCCLSPFPLIKRSLLPIIKFFLALSEWKLMANTKLDFVLYIYVFIWLFLLVDELLALLAVFLVRRGDVQLLLLLLVIKLVAVLVGKLSFSVLTVTVLIVWVLLASSPSIITKSGLLLSEASWQFSIVEINSFFYKIKSQ